MLEDEEKIKKRSEQMIKLFNDAKGKGMKK